MGASDIILLVNLAATWTMIGIIWFVQLVHYPLFSQIGQDAFQEYQLAHIQRTSQLVLVPMFIEAGTAGMLLLDTPDAIPLWAALLGAVLVGVIWLFTLIVEVPYHNSLTQGYDEAAIQRLVRSNWIRTLLWSGRGMLVLWMLAKLMSG